MFTVWQKLSLTFSWDSVSVEYRVRHKDGRTLHVMGNIKLIEENDELLYQRFLLDCTAQRQREKPSASISAEFS